MFRSEHASQADRVAPTSYLPGEDREDGVSATEEPQDCSERELQLVERAVGVIDRRVDMAARRLDYAESIIGPHALTVFACRTERIGVCRCGWTSIVVDAVDIDVIGDDHASHARSQLA